jgi:hypothetical protein
MFVDDEGKGSLDRFGFGFSAEDGFGSSELVLIELEMFVAYRGWVGHAPSKSPGAMFMMLSMMYIACQ